MSSGEKALEMLVVSRYLVVVIVVVAVGSGQMLRICTGSQMPPPSTSLLLPCRLTWENQRQRE